MHAHAKGIEWDVARNAPERWPSRRIVNDSTCTAKTLVGFLLPQLSFLHSYRLLHRSIYLQAWNFGSWEWLVPFIDPFLFFGDA